MVLAGSGIVAVMLFALTSGQAASSRPVYLPLVAAAFALFGTVWGGLAGKCLPRLLAELREPFTACCLGMGARMFWGLAVCLGAVGFLSAAAARSFAAWYIYWYLVFLAVEIGSVVRQTTAPPGPRNSLDPAGNVVMSREWPT